MISSCISLVFSGGIVGDVADLEKGGKEGRGGGAVRGREGGRAREVVAGVGDALGFGGGLKVEGKDEKNYWEGWWEVASSSSSSSSSFCFLLLLLLAFFHSPSTTTSSSIALSVHVLSQLF